MAFSPIRGSKTIERQYKRYLGTMFSINEPSYSEKITRQIKGKPSYQEQFTQQLNQSGVFSAGPFLDAHDNFATASSTRELVARSVLPEYFLNFGFHHERPLYTHQQLALDKAVAGKNIVVSTGTGSGKTESFLMPILAQLAREAENGELDVGVRALLIYPMNALANDQVQRLREVLGDTPEITFGCYTGQTKQRTAQALPEYRRLNGCSPKKNELISREQMKETPPHILITNYAMLEYLMIRPGDNVFFSSDTWRFVVLDEAHVYRGSTGIEVAMLLRRLRATLNGQKLQYFITSATLGDENENEAVAEFAENLTGEPFFAEDVIRAVRVPVPEPANHIDVPDAMYQQLSDMIENGGAAEQIDRWLIDNAPFSLDVGRPLFDMIVRDRRYGRLRAFLKKAPTPVNELCSQLHMDEDSLERFVTVASFAESDGIRLLDARYHSFLRATESVFITLPPSRKLFLTRRKEYHEQDGSNYKVFEIETCDACHAIYLTGDIKDDCLEQKSGFEGKYVFFLGRAETAISEDDDSEDKAQPGKICALCGHFRRMDVKAVKLCEHGEKFETDVMRIKKPAKSVKRCICCDAMNNGGVLRSFFTGQEAVTSVIATSLFNAMPDSVSLRTDIVEEEDEFGFGGGDASVTQEISKARQFLCFSDSRQASAYFASYLDTSYRKFLYRRMLTEQISQISARAPFSDFCEDLQALIESKSILKGTDLRASKESWKALLAEIVDMNMDASLYGTGIMAFTLDPMLCPANPKLGFTADEMTALINVLLSALLSDMALNIPVRMTEEDRDFYAYGAVERKYISGGGSTNKYVKTFIPKQRARSNKRQDYLMRVLDKKCPGRFDVEKTQKLMGSIWEQILLKRNILMPSEDGFKIDSGVMYVCRPKGWYRCEKCHKLCAWNVADVCPTYGCTGRLHPVDVESELCDNHYYRLYHDMDLRALRVREHTAQLDRDKAYEYQQDFKDKKIDVLSCSTTFEMGVDVGSLETVFMRNMPPMPSNYAQRAGRAGRSRNSAAFALTFCNRSNHDFSYFQRPVDMICGRIHAPHFNIINRKIAIRHLFASSLAYFWRKHANYFADIERMADEENGTDGFREYEKYLAGRPEDLRVFAKRFLPPELYAAFGCDGFEWTQQLFDDKSGALTRAVSEYRYEVGVLEEARVEAFRNNRSTGYYEERLRSYRKEDILGFLSRRNIIPQYGFPVDTVSLEIESRKNGNPYGVELQRDLAIAISEYAPDSQVVANGNLFTGRYIRRVPRIGWKMYDYAICDKCKTLSMDVHIPDADATMLNACLMCGESLVDHEKKTFLIPSFGFAIDPEDIRKPGLTRPEKTHLSEVAYVGYRNGIGMKDLTIGSTAEKVLYSEKDEMAVLNRSDFYICEQCGYGETGGFQSKLKKEHKTVTGRKCRNEWLKRYSLGYRFETDVFRLYFPDHPISYGSESAKAYSVLYALIRGIEDVLDLEQGDIYGCLQSILNNGRIDASFVFYDTTPGGAGHMRRLQDQKLLQRSIERALDLMNRCNCGGPDKDSSCYACLRNYNNQRYHDQLSRALTINYLDGIVKGFR